MIRILAGSFCKSPGERGRPNSFSPLTAWRIRSVRTLTEVLGRLYTARKTLCNHVEDLAESLAVR